MLDVTAEDDGETEAWIKVIDLVRVAVLVVVPDVVSSAEAIEAAVARTVRKMFEICILMVMCNWRDLRGSLK